MGRQSLLTGVIWSLAFTVALAGCGGSGEPSAPLFDDAQIVVDYADQVVVPTYELLHSRLTGLEAAVATLASSPTAEHLQAARDAWISAREPWEQSEAYLFGPVDTYGFDPALDSWPLDQTSLQAILASDASFDQAYLSGLEPTVKGFHAVEFLLFGEAQSRQAADLTARQLDYLEAISAEMSAVSGQLARAWTDGIEGQQPYAEVFRTAGQGSRAYPSLQSAAEEIVRGMIVICDEVAAGKIADPVKQQDPTLIESHYSYNSLVDFQNNLRSVRNAWTGDNPAAGTSGRGLHEFVALHDPDLEARIGTGIDAAITAIGAIPHPFESSAVDPAAAATIAAAQEAILEVSASLQSDVLPLIFAYEE